MTGRDWLLFAFVAFLVVVCWVATATWVVG